MVKIMEHPIKMDVLGGTPIFLETSMFVFGLFTYIFLADFHGKLVHSQSFNEWNLKMMVSTRDLLFQGAIFRFQGCTVDCSEIPNNHRKDVQNPS